MSFLTFTRMREEFALAMVAAAFLTFILGFIPNYQTIAYKNTEAREYTQYNDNAGYPAAEGFPTVNSIEEIEACGKRNFTITIDVSKLKPVDLYMNIKERTYSTNGFMRFINNNDFGGIGRFFVAELASGEQVVIFLDDTTISLPKEGVVTLPIGKHTNLGEGKFLDALQEETGIQGVDSFIDMAGDWRNGKEAKKTDPIRGSIVVVVFAVSWILFSKLFRKLSRR